MTSSNSITSGSIASARMIATRCCCPPESRSGYDDALFKRPKRSSNSRAATSATLLAMPLTRTGANVMLFRIERCGNKLNDWKTMPMRCRTWSASVPPPVSSTPPTDTVPASTVSSRLMQRSSVDFPEPDGPIKPTTLCAPTVRSTPSRTRFFPKDLQIPRSSIIAAALPGGPQGHHLGGPRGSSPRGTTVLRRNMRCS